MTGIFITLWNITFKLDLKVLYLTRANSVPQVTFPPCICVSHGLMQLLAWRDMMMMMISTFPSFAPPASFLQYCLEPWLVLCIFRACFTWMWNSNRFCILMIYTIGLKNLQTLIQSKVKLNCNHDLLTFSRALFGYM